MNEKLKYLNWTWTWLACLFVFCRFAGKNVKNQWRVCATVGVCAAQWQRGDATAGLQPSINSPQHILLTWPALRKSLFFPFLFFCAFITFCFPFRDPPSDILGCRSSESWAGWPWIQNPGRPSPVQRTAGSGHALWGEELSTFNLQWLHALSSNCSN